jgi:hypothetical protein
MGRGKLPGNRYTIRPIKKEATMTQAPVLSINLNQTIALSPDVISQEVSGETVLLDLESENYFGLDEVGTRIWQLIKETNDLNSIYNTLLGEYEVSGERLQQDLTVLLSEIEGLGLIVLEDAA